MIEYVEENMKRKCNGLALQALNGQDNNSQPPTIREAYDFNR